MGFLSYVSESEACQLAGVSSGTLNRFVEAGYLDVETENDGLRLFSIDEIQKVFSLSEITPGNSHDKVEEQQTEIPLADFSCDEQAMDTIDTPAFAEPLTDAKEQEPSPIDRPSEELSSYYTEAPAQKVLSITAHLAKQNTSEEVSVQELASTATSQQDSNISRVLEAEIAKFEKVNEVNELIIQLREKEIEELRQERNWLRQRVERLEEKAERDQILLLSETQLMKQLLIQQSEKRFSLKGALRWLGLQHEEPKVLANRLNA